MSVVNAVDVNNALIVIRIQIKGRKEKANSGKLTLPTSKDPIKNGFLPFRLTRDRPSSLKKAPTSTVKPAILLKVPKQQ